MRTGDVVNIDMEDLDLNQCLGDGTAYHEILIFDQKTGNRRNVWISEEAVEATGEWLKVRQDYLTQASEKCTPRRKKSGGVMFPYSKTRDDSRFFPFSTINARAVWNNAIESAEMDDRDRFTNRRKLHPHSLRKFYRTKRAGAGVPVDAIEMDMRAISQRSTEGTATKNELDSISRAKVTSWYLISLASFSQGWASLRVSFVYWSSS